MIIAIAVIALVAGTTFYGCVLIPPGSPLRYILYIAGGVLIVQFSLPYFMHFTTLKGRVPLFPIEIYAATAGSAVGLKLVMEYMVPPLLEDIDED